MDLQTEIKRLLKQLAEVKQRLQEQKENELPVQKENKPT